MTRARDIADQGAGTYGSITADDLTVDTTTLVVDEENNRVGIGTSSPGNTLEINNVSDTQLRVRNGTVTQSYDLGRNGTNGLFQFYGNQTGFTGYIFGGVDGERMRIDSSGNILLGRTTITHSIAKGFGHRASDGYTFITRNTGGLCLDLAQESTGAIIRFNNSSLVDVGSIDCTASATSYNTSSDYRLKEDWVPMSDSIARVKALNPVNFAWKIDGTRVDGFLAHEAQEVVPESVTGEKDEVEAIGNVTDAEGVIAQEGVTEPSELPEDQTWTKTGDRPVYQGIDQAKLVPLLTAALQEAIGRIETLEAEVAALKGA